MYCAFCGTRLDDSALFCSACGRSTGPVVSPVSRAATIPPRDSFQALSGHVRIRGFLWAAYSAYVLLTSLLGVFFARTMMPMFMHGWPPGIDPYPFMRFMRRIFIFGVSFSIVNCILGIWAAIALLRGDRAGRTLAIVVAFLSVMSVPLGTGLGIYTLVVLLREGAKENYEKLSLSLG